MKVLTACSSVVPQGNEFKALGYAFMENCSLDSWLLPQINEVRPMRHLSFSQRLNIAIDVATVLEYLHHLCQTPLAHCDLKPSNVLLNDEMTTHLSDFGLVRLLFKSGEDVISTEYLFRLQRDKRIHSSRYFPVEYRFYLHNSKEYCPFSDFSIALTFAEYGMGFHPTTTGDVYSYGVLLLEIFAGKDLQEMFHGDHNLRNYAKLAWPEKVAEISDPLMFYSNEGADMQQLDEFLVMIFQLGLICSVELPRYRKNMQEVTSELDAMRARILCGNNG